MAQKHLVAVGGTGQHVAMAYIELGVLGEWFFDLDPSSLWLFDADAGGPPSEKDECSAWDACSEQAAFLCRPSRGDPKWISPSKNQQRPYPEFENVSCFGHTFVKELGQQLFSVEQAGVPILNGYYGQPAVAATVFGALLDQADRSPISALTGAMSQAEGRIVVAGSAVGGTGSGCLPKLVEALGDSNSNGKSRIMAQLFLPWFRLEGNDDQAIRRNDEMLARTASGLFYYKDVLKKYSATVLLGHPDVANTTVARPWQADTQQSLHSDLTLPLYGAALAMQFLYGSQDLDKDLYTVPRPAHGSLASGSIPVFGLKDDEAKWRVDSLLKVNLELCQRLYWVAKFLDQRQSLLRMRFGRNRSLPKDTSSWAKDLRAWGEHKLLAVQRLAQTIDEQFQRPVPDALGGFEHQPPVKGLKTVKNWIASSSDSEPFSSAEELARHLAEQLKNELQGAKYTDLDKSTARLLPPIVAGAAVQVEHKETSIGVAEKTPTAFVNAIIAHDLIAPSQIPNPRAREFLLGTMFEDREIQRGLDLPKIIRELPRTPEPGTTELRVLLQRWFHLLVGCAAERVELGGKVHGGMDAPINLVAVANNSIPGAKLTEAREVLWTPKGKSPICVGYTSPTILFVPATLDDHTWSNIYLDISGPERGRLLPVVAAWVRMLDRALCAGRFYHPAWLEVLKQSLVEQADLPLTVFGLSRSTFPTVLKCEVRERSIELPLPVAGGRADGTWHTFFQSLGLTVSAVPGDAEARRVQAALENPEVCPKFNYFYDDGSHEARVALLLFPTGPNFAEINTAAMALQERYLISKTKPEVWDIASGGLPVEALLPSTVLLSGVGHMAQGQSHRLPDLPVDYHYIDLVDFSKTIKPPREQGTTVSYDFSLRGGVKVSRSIHLNENLIIPAGCLMWPRFSNDGWRQRFIRIDRGLVGKAWRAFVFGGDSPQGQITGAKTLQVKGPPLPQGYQLPDGAGVPRALCIVPNDRERYGVFLAGHEHIGSAGNETWGIDFGTSASVVAVNPGGIAWQDATLLRPGPATDSTLEVLLGNPVSSRSLSWFPSWEGKGPRQNPAELLPSRIVLLHKDADEELLDDDSLYGPQWMLDHGGPLEEKVLEHSRVIDELKWADQEGTSLEQISTRRKAYLLRLLEQAAAWRAHTQINKSATTLNLPTKVNIVFTLPLRMRDGVGGFERDVREVMARAQALTGIMFSPSFQWESLAGAIPETSRKPTEVYAMIDLGGGSLDLWGCYYVGQDERLVQRADSLLLGGTSLLSALSMNEPPGVIDGILRSLEPGEAAFKKLQDLEQYGEKAGFFFEVVQEVCARWLAAIALEAKQSGSRFERFNVGLLGRAWFLGERAWQDPQRTRERLLSRVQALGVEGVTFVEHMDVPRGQTDRKTYLARYVAGFANQAPSTLVKDYVDEDFNGYLGLDLDARLSDSAHYSWSLPLPITMTQEARLSVHRNKRDRQHPELPQKIRRRAMQVETTLQEALNTAGGANKGDRSTSMRELERSSFHHLIELIVKSWKTEESQQ